MTQYVGVKGWYRGDIAEELKRAALLFDRIAVKHVHAQGVCDDFAHVKTDIEWLKTRGIAVDPPTAAYDLAAHPWLRDYGEELLTDPTNLVRRFYISNIMAPNVLDEGARHEAEQYSAAADAYARVAAVTLQSSDTVGVPILTARAAAHTGLPTKKAALLHLVYERLPLPDGSTPWEAITDWRDDAEAKRKFARLRTWINKTSKSELSLPEVGDELEAGLAEYTAYMDVHHKKFRRGRLETFCVALARVLEEFPKIKLSPFLDAVFRAGRVEADVTEAELKAPNRDIAYIVAARERFRGDDPGPES